MDAQPHPGEPAHRQATKRRLPDPQRIQDGDDVLPELRHGKGIARRGRAAVAAGVVAHHAIATGQRGSLRLPHGVVGAERVREEDGGRGIGAVNGVEEPGAGVVEVGQCSLLGCAAGGVAGASR
ncbi:hypothetical protein D9M72_373460 [compost metagenome]